MPGLFYRITPSAYKVRGMLIALRDQAGSEPVSASQKRLAKLGGMHPQTVATALKELVRLDLIRSPGRPGWWNIVRVAPAMWLSRPRSRRE